jgi:hypothetical protein
MKDKVDDVIEVRPSFVGNWLAPPLSVLLASCALLLAECIGEFVGD